ncbi:MAG: fibronectin type III domain-containing protein [Acidobacteriota bacterium]
MRPAEKLACVGWALPLFMALGAAVLVAGCGLPAAPQPPSLKLPRPVSDLSARRTGDEVTLTWTMPKNDTSHVALNGSVTTRICRRETAKAPCATAANLQLAPGANGAFKETLPAALAAGAPRPLSYFVELINRRGRSAGLSNAATVAAGQAPAPISGLSAEVRKQGIVLRWAAGPPEPYPTEVRLERALLTPAPRAAQKQSPLTPPPQPASQELAVEPSAVRGRAIDKDIELGNVYSYRAQRVALIAADGKTLELAGPLSPPLRVDAADIFPPAVPAGLAAVATPAENGAGASIDLSWQPDTGTDLAGYAVYRREAAPQGQPSAPWQRISGAHPVIGPGFHDANVQPGRSYQYTVTAIGQNGHESGQSEPAEEMVPGT